MNKTKKTILSLAVSAIMALSAVGFAACNPEEEQQEEHKHTYATQWSSDATNHWHEPTCDDTTEVKDRAAHVDENGDYKCDVCDYSLPVPHEHEYAEEWSKDSIYHWHEPTCDDTTEVKDRAAHIDENNDERCDECDYDMHQHQHEYAEEWTTDADYHWHAPTCDDTIVVKDKAAHIDEDGDEKCDVCDYQLPHEHKYSQQWTTNESEHWHAPTCDDTEEVKDRGAHVDEDSNNKCDVCDYIMLEGTAITIEASNTQDISITLQEGVYELTFILGEDVTATQGGLTAHVNGSTYTAVYDMYEGLNETYYAVLFVREDSTAITLTNTTENDISARYILEEYQPPTLKADGKEYVVPRLAYATAHTYRGLFIPVDSTITGEYKVTINYALSSVIVYKNGGTTTLFKTFSSTSGYTATADFTGVESLNFRSGTSSTDYNITIKIEPIE